MGREEETAMEVVRSALGDDLYLCATEASLLRVIPVGNDFYVVYGVFRRRDHCCTSPDCAGRADTVDRNAVVLILLAMCQSLRAVFRLENTCVAAGCAGTLCAGKIMAA